MNDDTDLKGATRAMLALFAALEQREQRTAAAFAKELASLREAATRMRQELSAVAHDAGAKIAQDALQELGLVSAKYDRDVGVACARMRDAHRTTRLLMGSGVGILLLVLLVGWTVVGYYRRELAQAKDELGRYENAVPVVQAFAASDAILCGDRICVNVDAKAKRQGNQRQYRPAKPRPR